MVKSLNKPQKPKKVEEKDLSFIYQEMEDKLKESLATKVAISSKGNGAGKIEIEFFSHEDMERLFDILTQKNI